MNDNINEKPYLITGANIRYLAEIAVRHGHNICTVDYYGDWDTKRLSDNISTLRDVDEPSEIKSLVNIAEGVQCRGFIYGPGFENDIKSLLRLHKAGPVLGTGIESIRAVRSPDNLVRAASAWSFKYPRYFIGSGRSPDSGRWLRKPIGSMGGASIEFMDRAGYNSDDSAYCQEYIEGMSSSAVVVSNGSDAQLLGMMTQTVGDKSFGASGFRYVGNVYPHPFSENIRPAVTEIADALTLEFGLKGLWGFDFIYDGEVTLIEVNPRPSAGLGVLGMATMNDLFGMHIDSVTGVDSDRIIDPGSHELYYSSARVHAIKDCQFFGAEKWHSEGARDIPFDGNLFKKGAPVLTLHESDSSYKAVFEKLREKARRLYESLAGAKSVSAI